MSPTTNIPEGLRERHKRRRREAIFAAVRDLLREGGEGEPTKEQIAARAEVAPATVYNLVGTRERLWAALAEDFMDRLEQALGAQPETDALASVHRAVATTVDLFLADPKVSVRLLRGWEESGLMLRRAPIGLILAALGRAQEEGVLAREVDVRLLASSISTACVGAVHQWAAGLIDGRRFRERALFAVDVALAAGAAGPHHARLARALRSQRPSGRRKGAR